MIPQRDASSSSVAVFRDVRRHRAPEARSRRRSRRTRPRLAELRRRHQPERRDAARISDARAFSTRFSRRASPTDGVELHLPHGPVGHHPAHAAPRRTRTCRVAAASCGQSSRGFWPTPRARRVRTCGWAAPSRRIDSRAMAWTCASPTARRTVRPGDRRRRHQSVGARGVAPDAPKPAYVGQSVWRAVLPKRPDINTVTMWLGPHVKPGVNPVSKTEMYLFITEPRPTNDHVDPGNSPSHVRALLAGFPAPILQPSARRSARPRRHRVPPDRDACSCRGPGTAAASCSSATPCTPRRLTWRPAPASASRTPWSWPRDSVGSATSMRPRGVAGAPMGTLPDGGRELGAAWRNRDQRWRQGRARRRSCATV